MATIDQIQSLTASNEAARKNDLQGFVSSNNQQVQGLIDTQNAKQDSLFGQYTTASNAQEKLPDLYKRLQTEAGIPELSNQLQVYKDQIYRTKDLLDRLDEDVTSRTQGTLTSEAQRNRIIASEANPLETQLSRLGTGMQPISDQLTGAQGQLSALLPLYMQQQEKELDPIKMQINSLSDRFARELTGFTTQRENTLNALMDGITRGRQLDDAQLAEAQKLAAEEREFARQRALAAQAASYQIGNGGAGASGAAGNAPTSQQASDYNFVKNLVSQVQGGDGNTAKLIIEQARAGNARSKEIMRAFYAMQNMPVPAGFRSFI